LIATRCCTTQPTPRKIAASPLIAKTMAEASHPSRELAPRAGANCGG
jgi:hypothetical protein